jgi:hypothetical protein
VSWEVNDQEFEAVLHQTPEKQYDYFVGHCADRAAVWGLVQDESDWAAVEDDEGDRFFAVWPHPRYAEACRHRDWGAREPAPIEVHEFVDVVIPRLIADEMGVAVFPLPDRRHIPVPPRQLRSDLEAELMRME